MADSVHVEPYILVTYFIPQICTSDASEPAPPPCVSPKVTPSLLSVAVSWLLLCYTHQLVPFFGFHV